MFILHVICMVCYILVRGSRTLKLLQDNVRRNVLFNFFPMNNAIIMFLLSPTPLVKQELLTLPEFTKDFLVGFVLPDL